MKAKGVGAWVLAVSLFAASGFAACGGSSNDGVKGSSSAGVGGGSTSTSSAGGDVTSGAGGDATGTGGATAGVGGAATGSGGAGGSVDLAAALVAALAPCDDPWGAQYKTDEDAASATIPLCKLPTAIGWSADMDVDCDGKTTPQCNSNTDPAYYPETSATDSNGDPLDAASLPFVVIPLPNAKFDFASEGLSLGSVVAVVYKGQIAYGVLGDEGPKTIIGEASYAMAASLGIDPDPATGGAEDGVTYVAFTGPDAVVSPIEDHAKAVAIGEALVKKLVGAN
jgi:hypothetical protein